MNEEVYYSPDEILVVVLGGVVGEKKKIELTMNLNLNIQGVSSRTNYTVLEEIKYHFAV